MRKEKREKKKEKQNGRNKGKENVGRKKEKKCRRFVLTFLVR